MSQVVQECQFAVADLDAMSILGLQYLRFLKS
jgi:hypothetical protein